MSIRITADEIITRARSLPAFPRVVGELLESLDDEQSTLGAMVTHIERDPVIAARVLSLASQASSGRSSHLVRDVRSALSLVGLSHVREIVLATSLAEFNRSSRMSSYFWEHSVAVAVCAQELGRFTKVSLDYAFVTGLVHDIGQLWLARFYPLEFQMVNMAASGDHRAIPEIEQRYFDMDHCAIGRILGEYWQLPAPVVHAIEYHHDPDAGLDENLVVVTHIAEVLSNALDLTRREGNLVAGLSEKACARLGLDWEGDLNYLFGKIEARAEYACRVFR